MFTSGPFTKWHLVRRLKNTTFESTARRDGNPYPPVDQIADGKLRTKKLISVNFIENFTINSESANVI